MRLSSVVFYQGVKLWDNNLYNTVLDGKNKNIQEVTIRLKEHLLYLYSKDHDKVIIVGTANMRQAEQYFYPNETEEVEKVEESIAPEFSPESYVTPKQPEPVIPKPEKAKKNK